jgi:hypothetical protein
VLRRKTTNGEKVTLMKRIVVFAILAFGFSVPGLWAQVAPGAGGGDHFEVGVFADYFKLSRTSPDINFIGAGARAGFNLRPSVQIEAEMAYDFKRDFTSTFTNGFSTQLVTTRLRTLHALFGPKFQTNKGPARLFATFKAGLINFSTSSQNAPQGFQGALGSVTSGNTKAAIYPGLGAEGFWGPIGLRIDVGDEIYFDNGARNNLKVTFGPSLRF